LGNIQVTVIISDVMSKLSSKKVNWLTYAKKHLLILSLFIRGVARDKSMCRHLVVLGGTGDMPPRKNVLSYIATAAFLGHFKTYFKGNSFIFAALAKQKNYFPL